ncbi:SMP-30/gluconolactonase/LRE family protein [Brevibacterium aurantiacum]|uniref:hypothetical protein n=1 Tax=Brevibacterium aurantiacum TaxID=273384 RepID=UPI001868AEBD|nr:hypothetical protein [Brevibacterium aurantiacum]
MSTTDSAHADASDPAPKLFALEVLKGRLVRIDPGSGETTIISSELAEAPDGIVIDRENFRALITQMGQPDHAPAPGEEPPFTTRNGSVVAVDLNTGTLAEVVRRGTFTTGKQIARNPADGRIYWADREGRAIYRCEADGSNVTPVVETADRGPNSSEEECVGVAVDAENKMLYWTIKGPADGGKGRILRAGLEIPSGSTAANREDYEIIAAELPEVIDLDLDLDAGVLYWTDRGVGPLGNSLNRARIPAAGKTITAPTVLETGFHEAIGLALDLPSGLAYVSDLSGEIRAVDLTRGTSRTVTVLEGAATGIALG